jgi:hypothetical protein
MHREFNFSKCIFKILSFGGAIATVFVIFIPIHLKRTNENITLQDVPMLCIWLTCYFRRMYRCGLTLNRTMTHFEHIRWVS